MIDKKTLNILKDTIEKLDKIENLGHKVMAGRVNPTPQFSLKPPKEESENKSKNKK
ncbi:hypothetical protein FQU23_004950 [Flavobacterium sp. XN-5]|uniref:hypothetical protein n=1 Tax=Flavobacterium sp. XN-5 TaxID=2599390 RepID=UPI0013EF05F2|nr:hypothetical protein [Flavobacterium sp. XN-5]NGY36857.1 hypothetical protein [Flavobacterium sp. XN-5]